MSAASIVALSALAFDDGFEGGRVIWRNDEMKRGLSHSIAGWKKEEKGSMKTMAKIGQ